MAPPYRHPGLVFPGWVFIKPLRVLIGPAAAPVQAMHVLCMLWLLAAAELRALREPDARNYRLQEHQEPLPCSELPATTNPVSRGLWLFRHLLA